MLVLLEDNLNKGRNYPDTLIYSGFIPLLKTNKKKKILLDFLSK